MTQAVGTADALSIAGVDRKQWQNVVDRGLFPAVPKSRPRIFGCDDVVVLTIFNVLTKLTILPGNAARLASEAHAFMRKDADIETLYIALVKDASGNVKPKVVKTDPKGDGFPLQIGKWRKAAETSLSRLIAERDAEVS